MTEATLFLPGLSPVGGKTISATFDGGKLSSNGGVLILREIERKLGLAAVLSRPCRKLRYFISFLPGLSPVGGKTIKCNV